MRDLWLAVMLCASPAAAGPRDLPRHLALDAREAFWGPHLAALAGAGGLALAARQEDRDFQGLVRRRRPIGGADLVGDALGQPYTQYGYAVLTHGAARLLDSEELARTSELMFESLVLTGLASAALKVSTRRDRPDGSDELSFPSLHAGGSFALATAAQLRHGWRAGVPAGLLAGFVSFSRIQQDKHFASDSVFGAALGAVIAHAAWARHRDGPWALALSADGATLSLRF